MRHQTLTGPAFGAAPDQAKGAAGGPLVQLRGVPLSTSSLLWSPGARREQTPTQEQAQGLLICRPAVALHCWYQAPVSAASFFPLSVPSSFLPALLRRPPRLVASR